MRLSFGKSRSNVTVMAERRRRTDQEWRCFPLPGPSRPGKPWLKLTDLIQDYGKDDDDDDDDDRLFRYTTLFDVRASKAYSFKGLCAEMKIASWTQFLLLRSSSDRFAISLPTTSSQSGPDAVSEYLAFGGKLLGENQTTWSTVLDVGPNVGVSQAAAKRTHVYPGTGVFALEDVLAQENSVTDLAAFLTKSV